MNPIRIRSKKQRKWGDPSMIIGISAAVASLAFVVLVCYLVSLIVAAKRSLSETNRTLNRMREELEAVGKQGVSLMAAGEKLVKDADEKLHSLDPITRSVRQTGEALEQVTSSVKQVSTAVSRSAAGIHHTMERSQSQITEIAEFASMGMTLWQKWQSHRNAKTPTKTKVQTEE